MIEKERQYYHPGVFIKDFANSLEMTQEEFANRIGITPKQMSLLLNEKASITPDIASKLAGFFNNSIDFWLNLQSSYDAYKERLKQEEAFEEEKRIYEMIDAAFLKQVRIISNNKPSNLKENILALRKNTQVSSLCLLKNKDICSSFRKVKLSEEKEINIVCQNVWVSIAMNSARHTETKKFSKEKLTDEIDYFRSLTTESPEVFRDKLINKLADAGVCLILLPKLKNARINGVFKWINDSKAMIALNAYGSYNDRFWFSFFHELGHALSNRKGSDSISSEDEIEADTFARDTLLPLEVLNKLNGHYSESSILKLAKEEKIHPGIIVGRLQKEGLIPYSHLNRLKEKYQII